MDKTIIIVEKTAGYCIGFLAIITFTEAILRYVLQTHIPDSFVLGQMMQGIAICWGIATTTYADRQITVDILYEFGGNVMRRVCDFVGYTVNLGFMAAFGYAITFKVFDILEAGEISNDLAIPLWTGYTLASIGILAAVLMSAIRWWQVIVQHQSVHQHGLEGVEQ
ncbi:MAG: TRAP transporter small permease [Rhodospirillales bacterium]|nr:TRAP transporter small permease [Rhodospirillales bacterium]